MLLATEQNTFSDLPESQRGALPILTPKLIERIERALHDVGDFGEVRLVVVKGKLRFIQVMNSRSVSDA
ncbi:MAG: hypothetical protein Kow0047_06210 [Anaerolineae bacterium]